VDGYHGDEERNVIAVEVARQQVEKSRSVG